VVEGTEQLVSDSRSKSSLSSTCKVPSIGSWCQDYMALEWSMRGAFKDKITQVMVTRTPIGWV
jgi:hypothetical protein